MPFKENPKWDQEECRWKDAARFGVSSIGIGPTSSVSSSSPSCSQLVGAGSYQVWHPEHLQLGEQGKRKIRGQTAEAEMESPKACLKH